MKKIIKDEDIIIKFMSSRAEQKEQQIQMIICPDHRERYEYTFKGINLAVESDSEYSLEIEACCERFIDYVIEWTLAVSDGLAAPDWYKGAAPDLVVIPNTGLEGGVICKTTDQRCVRIYLYGQEIWDGEVSKMLCKIHGVSPYSATHKQDFGRSGSHEPFFVQFHTCCGDFGVILWNELKDRVLDQFDISILDSDLIE